MNLGDLTGWVEKPIAAGWRVLGHRQRTGRGARPVPTKWADFADAHQYSVPISQVSPGAVAEDPIRGMVAGKRSVIPGLVAKAVSLGGRFAPRSILLPALRIGWQIGG